MSQLKDQKLDPTTLSYNELISELRKRDMPANGSKQTLIYALERCLAE